MKLLQDNQSKKTFSGLIWSFCEKMSAQLVSTVITIILARLLAPEHYGMVAIVTVLITFLNVFVTGGFGTALVQKKDADNTDFNTTFWLSFSVSVVLYLALFFFAPLIASFYEMPALTDVIRIMGISLPVFSINNIQQAEVQRKMEFKTFFYATLVGTLFSGVAGVALAYTGFGIWALVVQYLTNSVINTIMLFIIGKWRPRFQFSVKRLKSIWSYGWKVLATQIVFTVEGDVRSLIVGRVFGASDLAFFDQGKKYPALLVGNVSGAIDKVMLPAYSKLQDQREALLAMLRRSIRTGIYILSPILVGFAMVSESFVTIFLTDKWLECVPYLQIFCLSYLFRPLESSCHQALLAIGKSGMVLFCMILINVVSLLFILISVFVLKSVLAIAIFSLLTTLISICVFLTMAGRLLNYSLKQQLSDILPSIALSLVMGVAVYLIGALNMAIFAKLCLQISVGVIIYIGASLVFKLEPFVYLTRFLLKKK